MDTFCGKLLSRRRLVIQDQKSPNFDGYQVLESRYTWTGEREFYTPTSLFHSIGFLSGEPLQIINTFDLSCCQAAYDPKNYKYITTPAFDETKRSRKGTIEVYHSPLKTANRVLKYINRGISFSYGELMKIYMVLDTEPPNSKGTTTNHDPFSGHYTSKNVFHNKEDTLKMLELEMEKAHD